MDSEREKLRMDDEERGSKLIQLMEAHEAYESHLADYQEIRGTKYSRFVFNRNRDPETLAYLMLDEDEQWLLVH